MKLLPMIKRLSCFIRNIFGKCMSEPYIQLTCVIIAGILGFRLSTKYQVDNANDQYKQLIAENDRKQAEEIFNEVSRLMDDRHYKTRRLLTAYIDNETPRITKYKESLELQLEGWNENEHRLQCLVESYFGSDIANFYMDSIQRPMVQTGMHIIHIGANTRKEQDSLKRMLNYLDKNIIIIDKKMITTIRENCVGRNFK